MKKVLLPALCSVFLMNCNESPPTSSPEKLEMEPVSAAVVAAVSDRIFTDGSGDVQTLVRTCDYPSAATAGNNCSYCALDAGWVLVGGGAEIEGSPSFARLRGSYPTTFLSDVSGTCNGNTPNNDVSTRHITWVAKSAGNSAHRLRAYVIGMKVAGLTESQLATHRAINQNATTVAVNQPTLETSGSGYTVGGGATEYNGNNCHLTENRPNEFNAKWRGSAYCPTPGLLSVYNITLTACPTVPGWTECFYQKIRTVATGPVTGYGTASVTTPYPWVNTGLGGLGVVNSGSSRFLADLLPLVGSSQGASVTTKDHLSSVSGTTTAYAINLLGGRWGTWRYNSLRFNTGGASLHRPSGAAPVALRQWTGGGLDAAPFRWYLEPVGGSHYRIRNANPSTPASGECAYRQLGTSNVLVGPCNTANEYKWSAPEGISGSVGQFKLQNFSSGTCLDNNNSTVDGNLRLATCQQGFSSRQSLFRDTYSWLP
jgi:hypothetical protein